MLGFSAISLYITEIYTIMTNYIPSKAPFTYEIVNEYDDDHDVFESDASEDVMKNLLIKYEKLRRSEDEYLFHMDDFMFYVREQGYIFEEMKFTRTFIIPRNFAEEPEER